MRAGFCRRIGIRSGLLGVLASLVLATLSPCALAQGTGPNINFLTPVGLQTITLSYLEASSNFRFGQTDFGDFKIDTNTGSFNYFYRFGLFDRLALIGFNANNIDIAARADLGLPAFPELRAISTRRRGLGDPLLTFRLGLFGTPALQLDQWLRYKQGFQLSAEAGVQLPLGDYDKTKIVNPGFNRYAYNLSLPMVVPIDGARRTTFLEIAPKVVFFSDNTDAPLRSERIEQDPLYLMEVHASHHLSGRWWLSLGVQYQKGGGTIIDGVVQDNDLNQWFGEVGLGVLVSKNFSLALTYGRIFDLDTLAEGEAWRFRLGFLL